MKTIIIGLLLDTSNDNNEYFPPTFLTKCHGEDYRVVLHRNVDIVVTDEVVTSNSDIVIDFRHSMPDHSLKMLLGVKYIWQGRLRKNDQMITLLSNKINGLTPFSVRHSPTTRFLKNGIRRGLTTKLRASHYVLKPESGAGGREQALVPSHQLISFLDSVDGLIESSTLKENYPDVVFTETNDDNHFPNDLVITEYIPDIEKEYRVMIGGNCWRYYERKRVGDTYKHANLDTKGKVSQDNKIELQSLNESPDLAKLVTRVVAATGMKLGSIDIYQRSNGEYGVIEYSSQFGTYMIDLHQVDELYMQFLLDIVMDYVGPDLTVTKEQVGGTS